MFKKYLSAAENLLGVDLDGDGRVGNNPAPQQNSGAYPGAGVPLPPQQGYNSSQYSPPNKYPPSSQYPPSGNQYPPSSNPQYPPSSNTPYPNTNNGSYPPPSYPNQYPPNQNQYPPAPNNPQYPPQNTPNYPNYNNTAPQNSSNPYPVVDNPFCPPEIQGSSSGGYPPPSNPGYPPSNPGGYPTPSNSGYPPPSNPGGYPQSNTGGYPPPSNNSYPPQSNSSYPPPAYPPQNSGYPPSDQNSGYPPPSGAYPPAQNTYGQPDPYYQNQNAAYIPLPQQQQQQQQWMPQPKFSGGNRKALLVGINYVGQQGQLKGCVNDVHTMRNYLMRPGNDFRAENMMILVDDPSWNTQPPTFQNIVNGFRWLSSGAQPGDVLFFHYSGHGGQLPDQDGDEEDGMDETLIPVDFRSAGQIRDDMVFDLLVAPLPQGCRLTSVMDCCHSGTAMDLPYVFVASDSNMSACFKNGKFVPGALPSMILKQKWDFANSAHLKQQVLKFGMDLGKQLLSGGKGGGPSGYQQQGKKQAAAEVIMLSGCKDSQTSADVNNVSSFNLPSSAGPGGAGGACTNALVSCVIEGQQMTIIELLERMRLKLKERGYTQVPQLSSSRAIDLSQPFTLGLLNR